jgi:FkbM family methyltransferase
MMSVYKILKKILPQDFYMYLQNKKRLFGLPSSIRKIVKNLESDDICVDCGANVGVYSQLFAKYGSQVYSFEPNPVAFNILKKKTKKLKNIYPIMSAVGTSNTQGKLYLHEDFNLDEVFYSQSSSLMKQKNNLTDSFIKIEVIDFAKWLEKFEKIKFIKIDIEGYEVELLNHLINSKVLSKIDYIFVETHEKKIAELRTEIELLKEKIKNSNLQTKFFWNWP